VILTLDITCGSGTTAFVAEKWGRRWITCDTSRMCNYTLAKQRLMTTNFDYLSWHIPMKVLEVALNIMKAVPHITMKSHLETMNSPSNESLYDSANY
jgi:adenine-specific DNA-methyltransferase